MLLIRSMLILIFDNLVANLPHFQWFGSASSPKSGKHIAKARGNALTNMTIEKILDLAEVAKTPRNLTAQESVHCAISNAGDVYDRAIIKEIEFLKTKIAQSRNYIYNLKNSFGSIRFKEQIEKAEKDVQTLWSGIATLELERSRVRDLTNNQ